MEDSVENEYIVTDENGCATDPSIFGEWQYSAETNSLLASFNAFKFPSSDNIRFQCNIRVCFGKCQPVNCGGYNAFGRRRRAITDESQNTSATGRQSSTALAEGDAASGQTREEIIISSNAILTFERRDDRQTGDGGDSKCLAELVIEDNIILIISFSTFGCSTRRRHLCFHDWPHYCPGHHCPFVPCGSSSCCFLLAYGIQETTEGFRTIATSTRIPEPPVRQSRRSIGTHSRLSVITS